MAQDRMVVDEEFGESMTISNNWKPDYDLMSVLSKPASGGNSMNTSQDKDICTQVDPPLSQFVAEEDVVVMAEPEEPKPPVPWARLICKSADLPSYELLNVAADSEGRQNLYLIGRGSTCNPRIETSPRISNKHLHIYCRPNLADKSNVYLEPWIEDLSANGTYLNKEIKLKKGVPRLLRTGDELHLINPALVGTAGSNVTAEDLVRNSFLIVIDLPGPPMSSTRTLRSQTLSKELTSAAIGRSNTVIRLLNQNRSIYDYYEMRQQLGEGACGTVYLGVDKATGREWAIKVIDTRKLALTAEMTADGVTKEAQMLRSLRHPNIIHLEDIFAEGASLYLVMELSRGGDLFDRISLKRRYSEAEAMQVIYQILEAIRYLHERNVAHRDLKPENILLVHRHDDIQCKLTDFGLAKVADDKQGLKSFCGTPQYFAPEVLERKNTVLGAGRYTLAADMWSVGVILFVLLAGQYPFQDQTLEKQIALGQYSLSGAAWKDISAEAKALVRGLLQVDPMKRLSAKQALQSDWLRALALEKGELGEQVQGADDCITVCSSDSGSTSQEVAGKEPAAAADCSLMMPPPPAPPAAAAAKGKRGIKRGRSAGPAAMET